MKKLIISLISLTFLLSVVWAGVIEMPVKPAIAHMGAMILGGGTPPGGEPEPGWTGWIYWDGDTCTGNSRRDAKSTGDTCGDETGTLSSATIINTDESNYYLIIAGTNQMFDFDLTGAGMNSDELFIRIIVKMVATTGDNNIFEHLVDSNNYIEIVVQADGSVFLEGDGQGSYNQNRGDDDGIGVLYDGYFGVVEALFSATNDVLSIRVCGDSSSDILDCDDVDTESTSWDTTIDSGGPGVEAWSGDDPVLTFGERYVGSVSNSYRITHGEVRDYDDAP